MHEKNSKVYLISRTLPVKGEFYYSKFTNAKFVLTLFRLFVPIITQPVILFYCKRGNFKVN